MDRSFKVHIPVSKSATQGELVGLASTSSVDRDGERMSQNALEDMKNEILRVGVNLFGNHEHSWENTLGVIKQASLEGDKLRVGITLDDSSTNPKVAALLNKLSRGINLGLSVGGKTTKTYKEYDKKLGKNVNVIDGVKLYEVSVVGIPSNSDAFVSLPSAIAKSANKISKSEDGQWEGDVQYELERIAHVTSSDAQGIMEFHEDFISYCYDQGMSAKETARKLNERSKNRIKSANCPACLSLMKSDKEYCESCFYSEKGLIFNEETPEASVERMSEAGYGTDVMISAIADNFGLSHARARELINRHKKKPKAPTTVVFGSEMSEADKTRADRARPNWLGLSVDKSAESEYADPIVKKNYCPFCKSEQTMPVMSEKEDKDEVRQCMKCSQRYS